MIVVSYILFGLAAVILLAAFFVHFRNNKVSNYLRRLNYETYDQSKLDIACGLDWHWRYQKLHEGWDDYSRMYMKMLWQFWKPLDSHWPDHSFHRKAD